MTPTTARLVSGMLLIAACRGGVTAVHTVDAYVSCIADRNTTSVRCLSGNGATSPATDRSETAILLTGQDSDLSVRVSGVQWSDSVLSFDIAVRSLVGQRIGTRNGVTPDGRGIRLVFVTPPDSGDTRPIATPMAGPGITQDTSLGSPQSAMQFMVVLDSGATSAALPMRLSIPHGATRVRFALVGVAPVPNPHGWLRITPAGASVSVDETTPLRAEHRNAFGRPALPVAIRWRQIGDATAAALTRDGRLRGTRPGDTKLVATCEEQCQATPDTAWFSVTPPAAVTLAVEPRSSFAISRFIYGANFIADDTADASLPPWYGARVPRALTLDRLGGNRFTAYNWRTNFSNAGADYRFQNDRYLEPTTIPGEAVRRRIAVDRARGAASLVTIPMLPYVAADDAGVPLDTAGATRAQRLATHFAPNKARRETGDAPGTIYQGEFVRWLDSAFASAASDSAREIFYALDNEPDIWHATHREIMSDTLGRRRTQTYDGFSATSISFATAIKAAQPRATIFGPAVATWAGVATLGQHPDNDPVHGTATFLEVYLDGFRKAEQVAGRRLLDVLDVHWYPEMGTSAGTIANDWAEQDSVMIRVRLEATRSLWDSTYNEGSWVSEVVGAPIALIPRLRRMVAEHYPGTGLSISEYFYGRAGDISGGLAQADALGVFGREGLFAATFWPQAGIAAYANDGAKAYAYVLGAFRLYRDYDGNGSAFGDVGLGASSSDPDRASIYASQRADGTRVLVVINRTSRTLPASIPMRSGPQPRSAQVWTMRAGVPVPTRESDIVVPIGQSLAMLLPAYSASTIVLDP